MMKVISAYLALDRSVRCDQIWKWSKFRVALGEFQWASCGIVADDRKDDLLAYLFSMVSVVCTHWCLHVIMYSKHISTGIGGSYRYLWACGGYLYVWTFWGWFPALGSIDLLSWLEMARVASPNDTSQSFTFIHYRRGLFMDRLNGCKQQ